MCPLRGGDCFHAASSFVSAAGLGMRVVGGKSNFDGKLGAFVMQVVSGGPADQNGIRQGQCTRKQVLSCGCDKLKIEVTIFLVSSCFHHHETKH